MTDFSMELNEDQITLRDWVHGFAEQQMRPIASEWDDAKRRPGPSSKRPRRSASTGSTS